ncbi:MAG TPA: transporter substrate-binding domain-containing protein [Candidatus Sulfotelmatobacter sp.]|nr:transporter substrate-binding domain-containing protein [Candidatus Sulfotelmatobacter sp.]
MSGRIRRIGLLAAALALSLVASPVGAASGAGSGVLRVCADPNYLPFSSRSGGGFENRVALAVGKALGEPVRFTWQTERGPNGFDGFLRQTLRAHKCDVLMDVPYAIDGLAVTHPYYVSSYVFVYPRAKHYDITSMDSPELRSLRIGFETDTPAETGLKLRTLITHATPFEIGDEDGTSPAEILDAVERGTVDVAVTWEPSIGYFLRSRPNLEVVAVPNARSQGSPEQYAFPMSMATRPDDHTLAARLDQVIANHSAELTGILAQYGVRLYRPSDVATQ